MRKLVMLVVCCCANSAQAALLLYDGFDYTPGELLAPTDDTTGSPNPGQHNVTYNVDWRYAGGGSATTQKPPGISSGSLSYTGLQSSTGNSVAYDTTQLGAAKVEVTSTPISSGTVYWSGLLRVDNLDAVVETNAGGMLLAGFVTGSGPSTLPSQSGAVLRVRSQGRTNNNEYFIGTARNVGTGTQLAFEATPHLLGQTVFIVASYEFTGGNDVTRMWIDPDPSTFGNNSLQPAATLTSSTGGGNALSAAAPLQSFNLRNVSTWPGPIIFFDELRVGNTWANVTPIPEPASLAMLLIAAALTCWRGRLARE